MNEAVETAHRQGYQKGYRAGKKVADQALMRHQNRIAVAEFAAAFLPIIANGNWAMDGKRVTDTEQYAELTARCVKEYRKRGLLP